jgi:hypothetical protein
VRDSGFLLRDRASEPQNCNFPCKIACLRRNYLKTGAMMRRRPSSPALGELSLILTERPANGGLSCASAAPVSTSSSLRRVWAGRRRTEKHSVQWGTTDTTDGADGAVSSPPFTSSTSAAGSVLRCPDASVRRSALIGRHVGLREQTRHSMRGLRSQPLTLSRLFAGTPAYGNPIILPARRSGKPMCGVAPKR